MGTGVRPATPPSPAVVFETLTAYQRTAALRAAIQVDLFRALGEGPADAATIAKRCGASERGVRILCDYLTIQELIAKNGNTYSHSPTSAAFLDPRSPACVAAAVRFMGDPMVMEPFSRLDEIVRTGRSTLPGDASVEPENPVWVEFAHSMAPMMGAMAGPLGEIALDGLSGPVRVLDIAAGHGLFGIEVAKRAPQARVTAVDWASVLEVAKTNAAKAGVSSRYDTLPGSAFDVDFRGPYDIVLLTNFLHHFDKPTCVNLLRKVYAATKPGGRAATLEFVPNEDRVSPPIAAAFSLTMLATTPAGDAYTFRELSDMYRETGFENISAHPVPNGPHTVVVGHRPK